MSLRTASLLAFIGMLLLTVLVVADLIRDAMGVMRDIIPTVRLLRSMIDTFASVTATIFLYMFYKRQS